MPDAPIATAVRIQVDGQPLDPAVEPSVLQVTVDDHLLLPDTFEIVLQETPEKDVARKAHLKVGAKVVISGRALQDDAPSPLITGEVTALEGVYHETKAPTLVVRGYDQGHRLMHARRSAVYRQQKHSDIARSIASGLGLQVGTIADSRDVFEYVLQASQTDWEFLTDLARESGFQVAVTDGSFSFAPPPDASSAPGAGDLNSTNALQLVFGQNLKEFRPRVTAGGQVAKVTVRGWDMSGKAELTSEQPTATTSVQLPDTPASIAAVFGSPSYVSGNRPRTRQPVVDSAAKALAEQVGSAFAEANGSADGNPRLKAGSTVSVSEVAAPFKGSYTLTHTRHIFDKKGYRTQFEVSGRQERTLLGLASGSGGSSQGGGMAGVQIGIVSDNADPSNLGRVRVQLPYLGHDFVTDWARVVAPGNGPKRGFVWLPEVHDEVLVAFHHGDVSEPYVLGGLWNGVDAPPQIDLDGGELQTRQLVSRTGQKIVFSDKSGSEGILISSADGTIQIHVDSANKKVVVTADGSGTVEMKTGGDFTIDCKGSLKIKGLGGVEISSPATTKVSGQSQLSLESGGVTSVKGATVSLG
jgi:uncharacterized protein involved in type VI secretion and phage assembly